MANKKLTVKRIKDALISDGMPEEDVNAMAFPDEFVAQTSRWHFGKKLPVAEAWNKTMNTNNQESRLTPGKGRTLEQIRKANPKLSKEEINRKFKQEESFHNAVNHTKNAMAAMLPVGTALNLLSKLTAPMLKKAMQSDAVKKLIARAVKEGEKIPAKLENVTYTVTGKLPTASSQPRPTPPVSLKKPPFIKTSDASTSTPASRAKALPSSAPRPYGEPVMNQGAPGWAARPKPNQFDGGALTARPRYSPNRGPTLPRGHDAKYTKPPGPNNARDMMVAAMLPHMNDTQKEILVEALQTEQTDDQEYMLQYPEEGRTDDQEYMLHYPEEVQEEQRELISEPGFGRMLGLRRSSREIERDVAITKALDAGNYDKVAELEKQYGSSDWKDSLTQRTKDYSSEQIEAMLSPEVSGSPVDELKGLFSGFEATEDTSSDPRTEDQDQYYKHGGTVKSKKKKSKPRKVSKAYSNQTRKPSRA